MTTPTYPRANTAPLSAASNAASGPVRHAALRELGAALLAGRVFAYALCIVLLAGIAWCLFVLLVLLGWFAAWSLALALAMTPGR